MTRISALLLFCTLVWSATAHSDASPTNTSSSRYKTCVTNNARMRAQLAMAPAMPEVSRGLGAFIFEDEICECMKADTSPVSNANPDLGYIEVNARCLVKHVVRNFERMCMSTYPHAVTAIGYPSLFQTEMPAVCACAKKIVDAQLTADGVRQRQLAMYREYQDRVAGRTPREVNSEPPGDNSYEGVIAQTMRCIPEVLGPPPRLSR